MGRETKGRKCSEVDFEIIYAWGVEDKKGKQKTPYGMDEACPAMETRRGQTFKMRDHDRTHSVLHVWEVFVGGLQENPWCDENRKHLNTVYLSGNLVHKSIE